jgi:GPH family glycoside/pentoside/hexuronide:cation symporter
MAIMLCESAVPAVAMLGAIVALCFYKLDPAQLEALENSQDTKA